MSFAWIVGVLIVGGFFRSLEFTSLNTIAYADVDNRRMSRATSLVAVAQQVSISVGVAIGALAVDLTLWARGRSTDHAPPTSSPPFSPSPRSRAARSSCSCGCRPTPAPSWRGARRAPSAGATEATDQKLS